MLALINRFDLLIHNNECLLMYFVNGLEKSDMYEFQESQEPKPLHLFITGRAGVGKSHLIHTLKMFLEKTFTNYVASAGKFKVLSLAPTSVSAINLNGKTKCSIKYSNKLSI